jgi:hypothetical protein
MIEELWSSREELQRHLRSSDYKTILLVIEMAKGRPEIRFDEVSRSSGVETIVEARGREGGSSQGEQHE